MKLSVLRSCAYNLASCTRKGSRGTRYEGAEGKHEHVSLRPLPTMSCALATCSARIKIFIVLPRVRAEDAPAAAPRRTDSGTVFFSDTLRNTLCISNVYYITHCERSQERIVEFQIRFINLHLHFIVEKM